MISLSEKRKQLSILTKKRNISLFRDWLAGIPYPELSKKYEISRQAIYELIVRFKLIISENIPERDYYVAEFKKHIEWIEKAKKAYGVKD